jgi:NADH:ubiquinone oxidoreductase subunit
MFKFLKIIFTWWNCQTIGTFLNTLFFGKLVGIDDSKNKYYVDSKDRRWVIFNTEVEATKIPPEWHAWIHHLIKEVPTKAEFLKYEWQKDHQENKTGTKAAYSPNKYKVQTKADYESWRP